MIRYVILIVIFFLTDLLSYKYIRKVDHDTRKRLDKEELDHVNDLINKYDEVDRLKQKVGDKSDI